MVEILEGNHGTKENGFTDHLFRLQRMWSNFVTCINTKMVVLSSNALNLTTPSEVKILPLKHWQWHLSVNPGLGLDRFFSN